MTSTAQAGTLEQALDDLERHADVALRALTAATKEAKRLKTAAANGQLRDVQQATSEIGAAPFHQDHPACS